MFPHSGLASSAFARHYSRNLVDFFSSAYLDVSLRQVPLVNLLIQLTIHDSSSWWFPNSEIPGSMLIYSSPRLIAVSHVLLRLLMPRHSPYALFRLNFLNRSLRSIMRCPSSQIIVTVCYSPYFAFLAKFVVINYTITERPSDFFRHTFLFQGIKKWSFLIICSFLFLFIRFSMNCEAFFYELLLQQRFNRCSRPKWTRTIDLTLIRRAL